MSGTLLRGGLAAALALPCFAVPAGAQFVKAFGSPATDASHAVFVDRVGNTYVTGSFQETVDFDRDNTITGDTKTSAGVNSDCCLSTMLPP